MSKPDTVGPRKVITLQYSLTNTDGVVVREASDTPINYLQGAGLLFPMLEGALESPTSGDIVTVRLLPDDAFGKRNLELLHQLPLDELPAGDIAEVGISTPVRTSTESK